MDSYEQMKETIKRYECGVCGGMLVIRHNRTTNQEEVACGENKEHTGQRLIRSLTQQIREEGGGPLEIVNKIGLRSPILRGSPPETILAELTHRFNLSIAEAASLLRDGIALGLDPFFGELAPLGPFKSKKTGKYTIISFITEKGWCLLGARECPINWLGPPSLKPLTDEEKKPYGYEKDDIVYAASGRRRDWPPERLNYELVTAFTQKDIKRAETDGTPSGKDPHHHCRVRATRRWIQEVFPEVKDIARTRLTDGGTSPEAVDSVIEGEYRIVEAAPQQVDAQRHPHLLAAQQPDLPVEPPKTMGELFTRAQKFDMSRQQVLEVLGYKTALDIRSPEALRDAWVKLREHLKGRGESHGSA